MKKWTFDQMAKEIDALELPNTEKDRQRYIALKQEILTEAGWTWDEYDDELERRLDALEDRLNALAGEEA